MVMFLYPELAIQVAVSSNLSCLPDIARLSDGGSGPVVSGVEPVEGYRNLDRQFWI